MRIDPTTLILFNKTYCFIIFITVFITLKDE